jgi:archaellum component FlaC
MTDAGDRLDKVEARLGNVEDQVAGLRTDVGGLRTDVTGLRTDVTGLRTDVTGLRTDVTGLRTDVTGLRTDVTGLTSRVGTLEDEVHKLRILGEDNTRQITLIAEVQAHHGTVLEQHSQLLNQLTKDVEPLKILPDLLRLVIQDHEHRITALERHDIQ